ncbi:hypothetical protein [Bauldia litoralis]|uniref:Uncharacterized protein n=1 Tax=Bauldia litoralis TaxID=665467 RepID=A0A1G6A1W2_9HYPH|nr:hypothetical protein [Bauldia litoralis]SDB02451.1 hypothetical protein SAMN02982931_00072 [Bauldia litoralis]
MRILTLAAITGQFALASAAIAQETVCDAVYKDAVTEISIETKNRSEKSYYFNLYCRKDGSQQDWVSSASVGFPIKGVPFKAEGDSDWSKEELTEFCQIGAGNNFFESADTSFETTVVTDALQSFNDCVALLAKDIEITHTTDNPRGVTFDIQINDPDKKLVIHGIGGIGDDVACKSTSLKDDQSSVVVGTDQGFTVEKKDVGIRCDRTPIKFGDEDFYPRRVVTLSTSEGSYQVVLPGDGLQGFHLASEAKAAFDRAIAERNQERAAVTSLKAENAHLDKRLKSVEMFTVYVGDNHRPTDFRFTCHNLGGPALGTPEQRVAEFSKLCSPGNQLISIKTAMNHGGGWCGHTGYAVICWAP